MKIPPVRRGKKVEESAFGRDQEIEEINSRMKKREILHKDEICVLW